MSTVPDLVDSTTTRKKSGPKLTEGQRRAIVAEVALGHSQIAVAQQFGVSPNTVGTLVKSVRQSQSSALSTSWRSKLTDALPTHSVDAIERSVLDTGDVHKAATTAIAHLKGIGVLAADQSSTVNVFVNQVVNLPQDWQSRYLSVESTPVELPATNEPPNHE